MLHEFLSSHRGELIERCRNKVANRSTHPGLAEALTNGVPRFLEQVAETLKREQLTTSRPDYKPEQAPAGTQIGRTAALHGVELLSLGYSMDQVVHDYGDVCQSVTDLAVEQDVAISADEFRTLNRCLDNAIADAVTSFGAARVKSIKDHAETLHERLNYLEEEQTRLIDLATHAFTAIKTGNVGVSGSTGNLLRHALDELRVLTARVMPQIHLAAATTTMARP